MTERGERASGRGDHKAESHAAIPQLKDLGISATQSSRWQGLAEIPDAQFEAALTADRPTTTGRRPRRRITQAEAP
jgi:hypothetical protein